MSAFPAPERRTYDMPGGTISAVHFGRVSNPLKLVMLHANGFNAMSYKSILEPLGVHALALDLRGHGFTDLPAHPNKLRNWHIFRDDVVEFFDRYIPKPVVLSGHSYGAVTGILCAPKLQNSINGFVGFDPVAVPLSFRAMAHIPAFRNQIKKRLPIARNAGRRRYVFDNIETAFERYTDRGAFRGFTPEALRDYLVGGLKPHADGVQLACHPSWEQAVFAAQAHYPLRAMSALPQNTHLIYGGINPVSTAQSRKQIAKRLNGGIVEFKPEFSHLFPMHHPEFASGALKAALNRAALTRKT